MVTESTARRIRDLGVRIGRLEPGQWNAITDVPGVQVGHTTLVHGEGPLIVGQGPVRTGVTVVAPRPGDVALDPVFAGYHILNGNGEMTGLPWIEELGTIVTPIAITNTHSVGVVRDALIAYALEHGERSFETTWSLPVVAETYDGFLNDINGFHVKPEHVFAALNAAQSGPIAEGCVGGGTGMICHGFKGGIGTSSRVLPSTAGGYTIGTLVQANHGQRALLRIDGVPVGQLLGRDVVPLPGVPEGAGSIIVVVATDAPLLPSQCRRLAQRATIGVARVGGLGENSSGDIFVAFSTGNTGLYRSDMSTEPHTIHMLPNDVLSPLFEAVADAVEEAILNALCAATTTVGINGRVAYALSLDRLQDILRVWPHDTAQV